MPADFVDRLRAWSFARLLLDRSAANPLDALRRVIAVYSSHPSAPLSLACRTSMIDGDMFRRLESERRVVRIPAMRGSIFLVPVENAARLLAATREPIAKRASNIAYAGLTLAAYEKLKPRLLEAMKEPRTPEELQEIAGPKVKGTVVVRIMSREGLTVRVSGSLRSDKLRYVATEAWLGAPLEELDADESLRWLADEYLRAFGPARTQDFAWWSGATRKRAAAALQGAVDAGDGYLIRAADADAFAAIKPRRGREIVAIPKWDPLPMGYAPDGRRRFIADDHLRLAYTLVGQQGATSGDSRPLLLRGGVAVASWSHRFERDLMVVEVTPFASGDVTAKESTKAISAIAPVLEAESVKVIVAS